MNRADYHPDWKSVSRQIREQAGDRCEFCGVENGAIVYREYKNADTKIVLTVAHLCEDKKCYDPTHLRALCQGCHLRLDMPHHVRHAADTRRAKRVASGQQLLVGK